MPNKKAVDRFYHEGRKLLVKQKNVETITTYRLTHIQWTPLEVKNGNEGTTSATSRT